MYFKWVHSTIMKFWGRTQGSDYKVYQLFYINLATQRHLLAYFWVSRHSGWVMPLDKKKYNYSRSYTGMQSRKSRNTWSNRQIWPWNMEWSRAKTNRVLPRKCSGHSKRPLPTTQGKTLHMDITRLQPKMEKLYTVSKNKTRSWLWLRPWTPYCQIQTEIEESRENH